MTDQPADALAERPRREPAINAPWALTSLLALMIGAHGLRLALGVSVDRFAFSSADMAGGRWGHLISYQFVHGSWAHVLMNAAFSLAFGAPVARLFGGGWRGPALFYLFFLACGAIAALAFGALFGQGVWELVGASGAASGLMGAAARLMDQRGRLGSPFGRTAIAMTVSWIVINLILGLSGLTPGAEGVPVAWQAHIIGFFAGLILVSPFAWLAGVRGTRELGPG